MDELTGVATVAGKTMINSTSDAESLPWLHRPQVPGQTSERVQSGHAPTPAWMNYEDSLGEPWSSMPAPGLQMGESDLWAWSVPDDIMRLDFIESLNHN
jgi:hypothetical protein